MIVREVDFDHADAARLRAAQREEIAERYGTPDSEPGVAPTASDISVFLVAYTDNEEPIGCGGLRELDATHAEIKRMFVAPAHRGTGASTSILRALEAHGRSRGWERLVLETGTNQPDAVRFYEREGYTRIPGFGHYLSEASLCFGKAL